MRRPNPPTVVSLKVIEGTLASGCHAGLDGGGTWRLHLCSSNGAQSGNAFGSDSLVELLSATVVLLQWVPRISIPERQASRISGGLLFVLSGAVAAAAIGSLVLGIQPETSRSGIAVTVAALIAMPVLASLKRREARRSGNVALAADAVQSATCGYLALITLAGLALNAAFHLPWFDCAAALVAIPILIKEGRSALRGDGCGCC